MFVLFLVFVIFLLLVGCVYFNGAGVVFAPHRNTMSKIKKQLNVAIGILLGTGGLLADESADQFESTSEFFQVISGQLSTLNPRTGSYTKVGSKLESYNAAGYNKLDGYTYAWGRFSPFKDQLIRIHADNTCTILGQPITTGSPTNTWRFYAGDMDYSNHLWLRGDRLNNGDLIKIDVTSNTYQRVSFSGPNPGAVADLVYQEREGKGYFYGCRNQDLYVWDLHERLSLIHI